MADYVVTPPAQVGLPIVGSAQLFPVRRVYCVGRNYAEHAKEMGFTGREDPFFFVSLPMHWCLFLLVRLEKCTIPPKPQTYILKWS